MIILFLFEYEMQDFAYIYHISPFKLNAKCGTGSSSILFAAKCKSKGGKAINVVTA